MLLAQEYAPDLTKLKDKFVQTPLGLLLQGEGSAAMDKLGADAQGRVQAMSSPEAALQTGFDFMGGGLLGTFVGKGSKLWKTADYNKALKLEKEGATPEKIWQETGTAKFADGQWRQEISDKDAKTLLTSRAKPTMLNKKLVHDDLFQAYPELNDVSLGLKPTQQSQSSYFDKAKNRIQIGKYSNPEQPSRKELLAQTNAMLNNINQKIEDLAKDTTMDKAKRYLTYKQYLRDFDTIKNNYKKDRDLVTGIPYTQFEPDVSSVLHETQHSIQRLEDWAKGGNVESASGIDILPKLEEVRNQIKKLNIEPYKIQNKIADGRYVPEDTLNKYNEWKNLKEQEDKILSNQISPFEAYKRLAGEAEARLTQRRIPLTDSERRANFPYASGTEYGLDYPIEELFVRGLLK